MRILIVDDEFVSRKKAQKILTEYGECDIASNGFEAIEAFHLAHKEDRPYDLITMDIQMPDMDGIEALKKIREWEQENNIYFGQSGTGVKVIMLTATEAIDSVMTSFYEGCEEYIIKPFNKEKVITALGKLDIL